MSNSVITTPISTIGTKLIHKINCFLGKEKETFKYESGKPTVVSHNLCTGEVKKVQEGTKSKTHSTFEKVVPPTKAKIFSIPQPSIRAIRVKVINGFKLTIWLELALLVIRHFAPEVSEQIPAVYQFLDNVALPIIDWLYAIAMKLVQFVVSQEWIASVLEWLKSLAM